jgi:hypothetical protein
MARVRTLPAVLNEIDVLLSRKEKAENIIAFAEENLPKLYEEKETFLSDSKAVESAKESIAARIAKMQADLEALDSLEVSDDEDTDVETIDVENVDEIEVD